MDRQEVGVVFLAIHTAKAGVSAGGAEAAVLWAIREIRIAWWIFLELLTMVMEEDGDQLPGFLGGKVLEKGIAL